MTLQIIAAPTVSMPMRSPPQGLPYLHKVPNLSSSSSIPTSSSSSSSIPSHLLPNLTSSIPHNVVYSHGRATSTPEVVTRNHRGKVIRNTGLMNVHQQGITTPLLSVFPAPYQQPKLTAFTMPARSSAAPMYQQHSATSSLLSHPISQQSQNLYQTQSQNQPERPQQQQRDEQLQQGQPQRPLQRQQQREYPPLLPQRMAALGHQRRRSCPSVIGGKRVFDSSAIENLSPSSSGRSHNYKANSIHSRHNSNHSTFGKSRRTGKRLKTGVTSGRRRGPRKTQRRPFAEARAFAVRQGLRSQRDWHRWSKEGHRPADIPGNPHQYYAGEWKGWGHFLGTNNISKSKMVFRSYPEARKFASSLGLRTQHMWQHWCASGARPSDIPSNPQAKYRDKGWEGWGKFLSPLKKEETSAMLSHAKKTADGGASTLLIDPAMRHHKRKKNDDNRRERISNSTGARKERVQGNRAEEVEKDRMKVSFLLL